MIEDRESTHALVDRLDLMVIKYDKQVSVMHGRCLDSVTFLSDSYVLNKVFYLFKVPFELEELSRLELGIWSKSDVLAPSFMP